MLRGIHKASSTWLGKGLMAAVMGFLVISFAIWGIGDIFRGFGRNAALTIGDVRISAEQFREYYNDQLRKLSRQLGRTLSPDQIRALGFDRQLIAQLVAETTLDEQAKALRLGIGTGEISQRITSDPGFRGLTGQFDRARFEETIRDLGFTEARFVEEQRRRMLRRQLALSISGDIKAPAAAIAAVNQYQNEQRSIDYIALGPAQAGDVAAPPADVLEKYFDEHKVLFRAPEYRKLTVLSLSPADLAKPDEVKEADAKAYYEQHKAQYGTPEKREIRQINYPNAEEAKAARDKLGKGATFDDLVKDRGLKPSDTDLGMMTKTAIIDPAIADAAFALKSGEISEPIVGQFGTVLLTVGKIEPGAQKAYEDVASQIKRELAESHARTQVGDLRDKVEDERAAGATLVEAGKKFGVTTRVIEAVDRAGNGPDGKPVADLPKQPNVVAAAFNTDVGVDNDAMQLPNGGYLYYDVTGITPSHERPLAEVKDQVAKRWRDEEIGKRLAARSAELLDKLKAGAALAELAASAGVKVGSATGLQRGKPADKLPANVVTAAFQTPKDAAASAEGDDQTQRYVFRVTGMTDPPFDAASPQGKALAASLQNSYGDDVTAEYLARLESQFGVDVDQTAINQVLGVTARQ
ncbi:MAG TPA: peptidyl-prolyl cis-trans isomerase [Pseudolabrys sp.]|nr:peptidyl-prolyl cis-trans isomerase [Pseudolabrys sp.]